MSRTVMRLDLLPVGSLSGCCMEHGLKAERVVSRSPLLSRFKGEKMKSEAAEGEKWTTPRMSQRDGKVWTRDGMRAGRNSDLGVLAQVTSWLEAPLLRLREEQTWWKMQSSVLDIPESV